MLCLSIPTSGFHNFNYILGANLGSLLHGDIFLWWLINFIPVIQNHKGSSTILVKIHFFCMFQCLLMMPIFGVNLKHESCILRNNHIYQSTYLSSAMRAHLLMKECLFNFPWLQGVKYLCCMSFNALYKTFFMFSLTTLKWLYFFFIFQVIHNFLFTLCKCNIQETGTTSKIVLYCFYSFSLQDEWCFLKRAKKRLKGELSRNFQC